MKRLHVLTIALALLCGAKASAQEWEYTEEWHDKESPRFKESKTLRNGKIAVTYTNEMPNSSLKSFQPGLLLLSPDGEELARNGFPKPAFWGHHPFVLSDEDGNNYMLAAYSPDHDSTSANFFMNFDNPPDYSILGLYKLDEQLSIVESHEFQIPVDTVDSPYYGGDLGFHNDYCGSIFVFSAFLDEGSVVGGYIKKPSFDYYHPHGNDSVFFFRIGLDGTLLNHVGYEIDPHGESGGGGLNWAIVLRGHNILKVWDSYVCFLNIYYLTDYGKEKGTENNEYPGHAYFIDGNFNIVDMKHYHQRNGLGINEFVNASYIGSGHNTVYLSSDFARHWPNGGTGCSLYEYKLVDDKVEALPIMRYIERNQSSFDDVADYKGVDIASDNSIYFAYTFNDGREGLTIEHLTPDFDTISTLNYRIDIEDAVYNRIQSIEVTEDNGLLVTFVSIGTAPDGQWWYTVAKFPAEAFVGVKEGYDKVEEVNVVYPNPAQDELHLHYSPDVTPTQIELYDLQGRLVKTQRSSLESLNLQGLAAGTYTMRVSLEGGKVFSDKIIKE